MYDRCYEPLILVVAGMPVDGSVCVLGRLEMAPAISVCAHIVSCFAPSCRRECFLKVVLKGGFSDVSQLKVYVIDVPSFILIDIAIADKPESELHLLRMTTDIEIHKFLHPATGVMIICS